MADKIVMALLYVLAVCLPIAKGIEMKAILGTGATSVQLSPADVVAWPAALIIVALRIRRAGWKAVALPPLPALAFLLVGLAGYFSLGNFLKEMGATGAQPADRLFWAKEAFKMSEIFLAVPLAVLNAGLDAARARRVAIVFFAVCTAFILYGLHQQFLAPEQVSDFRLGSFFDNRNAYGAFLAVVLPALAALALEEADPGVAMWAALAAVVGFLTLTSGGAAIGAILGILAVAGLNGGARGYRALAALLAISLFLVPLMPRENAKLMRRSLAPYKAEPGQERELPSARMRAWQASLNLIEARPVRGVGLGNYQRRIQPFYSSDDYPHPGGRTDDEPKFDTDADEPGSQSLFLVIACETGLPGLLLLLAGFAWWAGFAARAHASSLDPRARVLALAAVGAIVGACGAGIFGNPLVRGTGVSLALIASLGTCGAILFPAAGGERPDGPVPGD